MIVTNLCPFDGEEPKKMLNFSYPLLILSIECPKCGVKMTKVIEANQKIELVDILLAFDSLTNQWNRRVQ